MSWQIRPGAVSTYSSRSAHPFTATVLFTANAQVVAVYQM